MSDFLSADRANLSNPSLATQLAAEPLPHDTETYAQRVWEYVSNSPLRSLWDLQGIPAAVVAARTLRSFTEDNLFSRAAELGYYFLFALFPALICASAIFGLFARSASEIYIKMLNYLSLVVPRDALGLVMNTFTQTTEHSTGGKVTFGLAAALWSASVGFSAIQDTLNTVYKVKETRPYWMARGAAILVTILLAAIALATLGALLAGTLLAHRVEAEIANPRLGLACAIAIHLIFDAVSLGLNLLAFATIYYFGPALRKKAWRTLTPGAAIGILGWILASMALRVYLYYFNSYSVTYGSLGAVIILLTWFYITGLMLLTGAEINSEIEAAVAERRLKEAGEIPRGAKLQT